MASKASSQHLFRSQDLMEHTSPATPQCSKSEFDVLVDLLGTDEPKPFSSSRQSDSNLGEWEGCLDFGQVDMFTSGEEQSIKNKGDDIPLERYFEDFVPYSNSADPSRITRLDIDHVPDERTFQAGLLAPKNEPGQLECGTNTEDLIDLSLDDPFEEPNVTNQTPPRSSSPTRKSDGNAPTFSSIRTVLDMTHREVEALREHCKELEDLIRKSGGRIPVISEGVRQSASTPAPQDGDSHNDVHPGTVPPRSNNGIEGEKQLDFDVDSLSLSHAQRILKRLVEGRTIPTSIIQDIFDQKRESNDAIIVSTSPELLFARDFTLFVDELVWRRSRFGSDYDDPLSHENIDALKDRIELWEQIVRSRR